MAKPRASSKKKQCHACGKELTPAYFKQHAVVCNLCLLENQGVIPADLPFAPKAPEPPPRDTSLDGILIPNSIETLELAERILAQRSMLAFVQRFKADYQAGWVHQDICRRLERFMRDVEAKKSPRLLLCMPPRHGKSTLTSNFFPPWLLGHHPNWEIIAASHTQSLALKFSGFIRDLLRDPAYQAMFPDTLLNPDSQSKEAWDTTARGGYLAAGIGTGITGRGAHVLIIDDPVKDMEAADSVTIRDNTWEWYTSTAYTRLAPGGGVLGILTLWNEDDWGGRIIEISESGNGDIFEIVRYPAINEGYAEVLHSDERTIIQVPVTYSVEKGGAKTRDPIVVPEGHTLIRAPDSALHPDRYNLEALLSIKRNYYARGNQRVWHALYQQAPSPEEGVFFTKGMFRFYSTAPSRRHRTIYQAWDFAITEKQTSDYTVGVTLLQDENDSLYVLDVNRFREDDSHEIVERVLDYARDWDADMLGFEDGQIWKAMFPQFEKRCRERVMYPTYETLTPLTDKKVRAFPLRGRMQLGKIYFNDQADWWEPLRKEMLSFQGGGKHDDQVDALAWAVRLTLSHAAPVIPLRNDKIKSWKDNLNQYVEGGDATHMAA